MSVSNKKIRELESAAIDAAHAIDDLIEQLEGGGSTSLRDQRIANRVERLRLAAIELDRAETACSRERTLTMSEEEMREEFEALGMDWDETTERGHALLQRLLGEHDARREAEIAKKAGELAAGMGVGIEDAQDKVRMGESVELGGADERPRTGFKLPDAPAVPQPRGLSYWYDLIEKVEPDPDWVEAMSLAQAEAAREHVDVPPDPSGEAVVRLDDGAIRDLLAAEIAREFDLDPADLSGLSRTTLLRLRADFERAHKLAAAEFKAVAGQSPAEVADIIRSQYEQAFGVKAPPDTDAMAGDVILLGPKYQAGAGPIMCCPECGTILGEYTADADRWVSCMAEQGHCSMFNVKLDEQLDGSLVQRGTLPS
jgi:hypothetical protein